MVTWCMCPKCRKGTLETKDNTCFKKGEHLAPCTVCGAEYSFVNLEGGFVELDDGSIRPQELDMTED